MNEITKYFPNLTQKQREQFAQLKPLYEEWNAKINVISRRDMEHFYERHVLHSLAIAKVCPFPAGARIMDVGTGGGFPGIPLAILFPQAKFWLVDSIGKKISVVRGVAEALGLTNVVAVNARAEAVFPVIPSEPFKSVIPSEPFSLSLRGARRATWQSQSEPAQKPRHSEPPQGGVESASAASPSDKFDWVVSRAVTDMKTFLTWVDGKINHGILYLKGGDLTDEMRDAGRPYTLYDVADLFEDEFFATKRVVRINY